MELHNAYILYPFLVFIHFGVNEMCKNSKTRTGWTSFSLFWIFSYPHRVKSLCHNSHCIFDQSSALTTFISFVKMESFKPNLKNVMLAKINPAAEANQ